MIVSDLLCPVVHRDIKAANVLVKRKPFQVKLADFGCARCDVQSRSDTIIGSLLWMAPEVFQRQDGYGRKADIWSFGCTVIEMLTAQKPWGEGAFANRQEAVETIARSTATPPVPPDAAELFQGLASVCTRRAEDERPDASELLSEFRTLFESG